MNMEHYSAARYFVAQSGDKLPGRDNLREGGLTSACAVQGWCRIPWQLECVVKNYSHHGDQEAEREDRKGL